MRKAAWRKALVTFRKHKRLRDWGRDFFLFSSIRLKRKWALYCPSHERCPPRGCAAVVDVNCSGTWVSRRRGSYFIVTFGPKISTAGGKCVVLTYLFKQQINVSFLFRHLRPADYQNFHACWSFSEFASLIISLMLGYYLQYLFIDFNIRVSVSHDSDVFLDSGRQFDWIVCQIDQYCH